MIHQKFFKAIPVVLLCLFSSACTTLSSSSTAPSSPNAPSWHAREVSLNRIHSWTVSGVLGVKTPDNGVNVSFNWEQVPHHYHLEFYGPLGVGHTVLEGTPSRVTLFTPDDKTLTANNAEQLLQRQLGWYLPVSNLTYWIRGLPTPRSVSQKTFDSAHRLSTLSQQGWQVQYSGYTSVDGIELPARMTLSHPKMHVRVVVRQWQIR